MTRPEAERRVRLTLLALAVLAGLLVPVLFRTTLPGHIYWTQIYIWTLFFAYCATAWNVIGGFAGQYSIGHAAFLGIGAYTSTLLYLNLGLSPWLGMIAGGLAAAAVSALIGYPCFRLRGAFFTLSTIAFAEMLRVWGELTETVLGIEINGASGLTIPPVGTDLAAFQFRDKASYAYVMYALLLAALLIAWLIKRSRLGYYLAAIRDDEDAVRSLGINTARVKLAALLISAFLTAVAGTFYAQMILFIVPTRIVSLEMSVQMVVMAVLGGLGTVFGPLLGALLLVPVAEITRGLLGGSAAQGVHFIVYGAILMAAIRFIPNGIESWARRGGRALVGWLADRLAGQPEPEAVPAFANAPVIDLPADAPLGLRAQAGDAVPLKIRGLVRRFGGAVGVQDLTLEVEPGEVVGLIGPNGSGKTTVFNLVTGYLGPQSGTIRLGDADITGEAPHRINRMGVARTFQIVRPFLSLTALENVMVAALPRVASVAAARAEAARYLAFVGLSHRLDIVADGLSTGERKRLELARALATRPRLLLMDEVTGGVDQRSLPGIIALMQKIKREGISLLVIEHNLRVITAVADRIVVLNLGEKLREGAPREVVADPKVIEVYVGGGPVPAVG
ncbi:MAG TPA: ATP-binding cassette domain-containing protein [Geminicoccaceae bacterium]|nr:ATP-binding cassette domain-containing protein [Geminicoccaceae bacterium]